MKLFQPH